MTKHYFTQATLQSQLNSLNKALYAMASVIDVVFHRPARLVNSNTLLLYCLIRLVVISDPDKAEGSVHAALGYCILQLRDCLAAIG
jgi:hypothetical protein